MVHRFHLDPRAMQPFDAGSSATVRVADLYISANKDIAVGFTEYTKPSRLDWTFQWDEVFYVLEGTIEIHVGESAPVCFEVGDVGIIENGTQATIVVPQRARFLHVTQPAWGV